uniref:GPI inositol-deacylase n=1 Tax=Panagrolaimus superbus TaxID=310955 RepID=A0A914Z6M8_9BILA
MYMDVGFKHDFNGYSLLLYGEGLYVQKFLQDKKVDGLPIIFVPGNAGSAKQARSIGSVLQNKTDLRNTPFHFDVFTLNFNEQFSGLSSSFLLKQADFLEVSVKFVSKMYENPPPGIIFIGHSMGGIVIREVVRRPSFDMKQVSLILTFATPHLKPPIIVDSGMYKLWRDIETAWNETRFTSSHVRVVSISSGLKDEMISETLTRSDNPTVYHYVTTGIDRVWVEADHQCIVWCNQLVRHTSRLIFYYAENMESFRQNIDSTIKMFYSGVGRELRPILRKGEVMDATVCPENEACNKKGIIEISKSSGIIILTIGNVSNYQLISSQQHDSCSLENRYLSENSFYNILESKECNDVSLLVNTNASKLWIINSSQIYLSPLTLQSAIFQHAEARRFTVSKGMRRLKINFFQVTQTSVFVVSIVRKCTDGDFRAVFEIDGVQRFDEFLTKEKTQRIIRILSHSGKSGILTFFDTEKCSYDIKIQQDWKNTVKLALLEWVSILPGLIFCCLCFFVYIATKIGNTFIVFAMTGISTAAGSPLLFKRVLSLYLQSI